MSAISLDELKRRFESMSEENREKLERHSEILRVHYEITKKFNKKISDIIIRQLRTNMRTVPFDLEKARAGAPVCTRDGRDVRIICWDKKNWCRPIVALIASGNGEVCEMYTEKGTMDEGGLRSNLDLFMKVETPILDDYTTIKTYEDACEALGEKPWLNETSREMFDKNGIMQTLIPQHIIALMKLETISKALRNGWKPDEETDLPYMPVFEEKMRCLGAYMSGSIPRLYQETEEKAEYFGTQFIDLWKEYLSTEE